MEDVGSDKVEKAISHFQRRAEKALALEKLLAETDFPEKLDLNDLPALERRARLYISIAQARYDASEISEHELLFHKCFAIENQVHESRWSNGVYEASLNPISEKMKAVEKAHGLADDEFWLKSDAPEDYRILSAEYDKEMENKLLETFVEFGADDLKNLYLGNREEFDRLHHIGGKSIFLKGDKARLQFLASSYEDEAERAEQAGAFLAASVMLGSAIETRLIVSCLDNEQKIKETLDKLQLTSKELKSKNPVTWSLDTLIKVCSTAGWVPDYKVGGFTFSGSKMAEFLRSTRNQVHPKVKLKKSKGLVMGLEQFKDIRSAHSLLSSSLNWPNKQKQSDA